MKKTVILLLLAISAVHAADDHKLAGPNGGRVIESVEPHAEFLVLEDRRVQLTFLDEEFTPIPPADQTAKVISGDRSAPTELSFTKTEDALISDVSLPEGDRIPAVLQITPTPDGDTITEGITVNLAQCPTCDYAEYACTCAH